MHVARPADEPEEGPTRWREELRGRMLGALFQNRRRHDLQQGRVGALGARPPIYRWWLFEGTDWGPLEGPLCERWGVLHRKARALLRTHNPRLRVEDRATAEVDWPRTFSRGPRFDGSVVARASRIGLLGEEAEALRGFLGLVAADWADFVRRWALSPDIHTRTAVAGIRSMGLDPATPLEPRVARWARTATRSRWPLLRALVAPALRGRFEPSEVLRIPLPTDRDSLFELAVLGSVADGLGADWRRIRWFTRRDVAGGGSRVVSVGDLRVTWQAGLGRSAVLAASLELPLQSLVEAWGVRVHSSADLLFDLRHIEGRRWDFVVVEVKSGDQGPSEALWQLRAYGRTLQAQHPGARVLALGVGERTPALTEDQREFIRAQAASSASPAWGFCGRSEVAEVLRLTGG